jgi:hypothetical protein
MKFSLGLAMFCAVPLFTGCRHSIDTNLRIIAYLENKSLPKTFKGLREDSLVVYHDTLVYYWTMLPVDTLKDLPKYKKEYETGLLDGLIKQRGLQTLFDRQATLGYEYISHTGNYLFTVFITPDKYFKRLSRENP